METLDNDTNLIVPENPEGNVSSRKESRKRKAELKTEENVCTLLDDKKVGETSLEPAETKKKMKKKKAKDGNTEEDVAAETLRDGEEKKKMKKKKKAKTSWNVVETVVELVADDGSCRDGEEAKKETNHSSSVEMVIEDNEMVPTDGDAKMSDTLLRKKKGKKKQKSAKSCDFESSEAGETMIEPEAVGASRDGDAKIKTDNRNDPGAEILDVAKADDTGLDPTTDVTQEKKIRKRVKKTRGDDGEATKVDTESASVVHMKAEDTSTESTEDGISRDGEEKVKESKCISALGTVTVDTDSAEFVAIDTGALAKKKIKKRKKKTENGDLEATQVENESTLTAPTEPGNRNGEPVAKKKKSKVKKKAKTSENLESATVDNERTLIANNTTEDGTCLDYEANVDQAMDSEKLVPESLANTDKDQENQNVSTLESRETEEDVPLECPVDTEKKKRNRKKKKVKATGDNVCGSKEELGESSQDAIADNVMEENMDIIQSSEKPSEGKPVSENPSEKDNIRLVAESSGLNCDSIKESSPAIVGVLSEANNSSIMRVNHDHDSEADGSVVEKEIVTYKSKKSRDSMEASKCLDEVGSVLEQVAECPEKESEENLPVRSLVPKFRKKLLILDVNGILVDFVEGNNSQHKPDIRISGKDVFKRPYCDEFLEFCFERFTVAVWTSRLKRNMEKVIDFLFGESQKKLLFSWDRSQCTLTGFKTIENQWKPLVLKELKKVWDKVEPDLPYEKGVYDETNTLLVDDSPYKAIRNPANTAIFPREYRFTDRGDKVLGPGGALRDYLEGLVSAKNVQKYVNRYPFGLPSITKSHRSWDFYERVIKSMERQSRS